MRLFLLLCSHGFQQSFSRPRKREPMYCITVGTNKARGVHAWMVVQLQISACILGLSQTVSFGGFETEKLLFRQCCAICITGCSQMSKRCFQACKFVLYVVFDTQNVEISVKASILRRPYSMYMTSVFPERQGTLHKQLFAGFEQKSILYR